MNLLSLVDLRLDNICQIRRKLYYLSGLKNLPTKQGLDFIIESMELGAQSYRMNRS